MEKNSLGPAGISHALDRIPTDIAYTQRVKRNLKVIVKHTVHTREHSHTRTRMHMGWRTHEIVGNQNRIEK